MNIYLPVSTDAAPPVSDEAPEAGPFDSVPPRLRAALEAHGFSELTSIQRAVLAADVAGRDLQISSQTGSGKTIALGFVLAEPLEAAPSTKGPTALIIVPTRELAVQVCKELRWLLRDIPDMHVASVTGGSPVYLDRRLLSQRPRVLVGTPGRLLDHVTSGVLDLGGVRELVLDEADQMLDMGFREELEGILDQTPPERRTHMVFATFPDGIQCLAGRYQRDPYPIEGTRLGEANQDIEHEGHLLRPEDRYSVLVNLLLLADGERTLVFVAQRVEAAELAARLEADGFSALPLSGELAQSQRTRTLASFRAGHATVLVATDVAARGLDVPDVNTVVHTTPPIDAQVYTHRSGRTGRAGKRGRSVLFAPFSRRRRVSRLLTEAGVDLRWVPVPTADEVRARLAARSRKELAEGVDTTLAAGPSAAHLEHAKELLADREAAPLVAALLARLEPKRRAEPRDVEYTRGKEEPRAARRSSEKPFGARKPGASRPERDDMVRFFMNWGVNQGAKPNRLLAAVCRRGQVKGADIGSIAIHPNASTFDVRREVAERFERLAGRRDPRDPQTRIRKDRGPRKVLAH